ncbi:hypothetical protein ACIQGZ_03400 [Streptomyces sp. NPDC092296]|uniref:hypothetical protein n=1 Tax=Streptomyces sp. NPDC092296 TaxID=3366012 RepID=UPI003805EAA7
MAFSTDELRVLRRALAQVLHPAVPPQIGGAGTSWAADAWTEDVQDFLRLAESIDEAVREGGRLRAFLLADLARYRDALPGSAPGYLERLEEAVADGYLPGPEDLRALRRLGGLPCTPAERYRRSLLAGRCHAVAEAAVRERLAAAAAPPRHLTAVPTSHAGANPMSSAEPRRPEQPAAEEKGKRTPAKPGSRPVPTPAELFARRPRPADPDDQDGPELATGTG